MSYARRVSTLCCDSYNTNACKQDGLTKASKPWPTLLLKPKMLTHNEPFSDSKDSVFNHLSTVTFKPTLTNCLPNSPIIWKQWKPCKPIAPSVTQRSHYFHSTELHASVCAMCLGWGQRLLNCGAVSKPVSLCLCPAASTAIAAQCNSDGNSPFLVRTAQLYLAVTQLTQHILWESPGGGEHQ